MFIEPENLQSENLPQTTSQDKAIVIESARQRIFNEEGNLKKFSSPSQDQKSETHDGKILLILLYIIYLKQSYDMSH